MTETDRKFTLGCVWTFFFGESATQYECYLLLTLTLSGKISWKKFQIMDMDEEMIKNVDGIKMIRRGQKVEKTDFSDVGCWERTTFLCFFCTLTFLANLRLNVNTPITSVTFDIKYCPANFFLLFLLLFLNIVFKLKHLLTVIYH